ncbi:hypothetical protein BDK51DRAFT_27453 [Blyttiomyces helicus]|uniref:Uncharacterized protein n=1 Tax=Blyttiomyces helicus TaxID=388810 RepID=A0A4P9WQ04_9FUNG|nr:hypothetical protein BDK51DRAFT_27453 [Blyttiomyces helicus]|eukprot:RKO94642.1 hypothetical protein BDK51DRAFT_27453 [Blyttiomyces helicus]
MSERDPSVLVASEEFAECKLGVSKLSANCGTPSEYTAHYSYVYELAVYAGKLRRSFAQLVALRFKTNCGVHFVVDEICSGKPDNMLGHESTLLLGIACSDKIATSRLPLVDMCWLGSLVEQNYYCSLDSGKTLTLTLLPCHCNKVTYVISFTDCGPFWLGHHLGWTCKTYQYCRYQLLAIVPRPSQFDWLGST